MGIVVGIPLDGSVLDTGSETATLPASNLLTTQPTDVWRATDLGAAWVELDLGAGAQWDVVGLLYTNATAAATWRVRGATTQAGLTGAPGYDSGTLSHWPVAGLETWTRTHAVLDASAAGALRYIRVDVSDPANPATFYEAGRLVVSQGWRPRDSVLVADGLEVGWIDQSPIGRSLAGHAYPDVMPRRRAMRFGLSFLTDTEMFEQMFELQRLRGISEPVLVSLDPTGPRAHDLTVYGLLTELQPIRSQFARYYESRLEIEEMI